MKTTGSPIPHIASNATNIRILLNPLYGIHYRRSRTAEDVTAIKREPKLRNFTPAGLLPTDGAHDVTIYLCTER